MSRWFGRERLLLMKKTTHHLIAEVPDRRSKAEMTIGIDLGDVWSHYCTLNEDGQVVDRGRFRTTPKAIDKWFTDVPHARVAMEAGTHSIWISEQLQELGHEVIVANVRELRAISHSDRKSDQVDAEKLARYARLDPEILRPIECANHILRPHGKDSALRQWGLHLAARGGKQAKSKAVVAVARKLAVLLHRLWSTQEPYVPFYEQAA